MEKRVKCTQKVTTTSRVRRARARVTRDVEKVDGMIGVRSRGGSRQRSRPAPGTPAYGAHEPPPTNTRRTPTRAVVVYLYLAGVEMPVEYDLLSRIQTLRFLHATEMSNSVVLQVDTPHSIV